MKKYISTFLCISTFLFSGILFAQPGSLDLSFNPGAGANQAVYGVSALPGGKTIVVGSFSQYSGASRIAIACANSNGTNDATFIPPVIGSISSVIVYCEAIQPDGKIVISGQFNTVGGISRSGLARLNADGTHDVSFTPGTGLNGHTYYHGLAIQPDGKIIVAGLFTNYNGVSRKYIARANADGTLDTGFLPGTGFDAQPYTVNLQPDGKMIVGGSFTVYAGTPRNYITRLNADATIDLTFNPGSGADGGIYTSVLQPDGKVIIGGGFTYYDGAPAPGLARVNADGTLDATFNPGTGAGGSSVYSLDLQPDGKILVGGNFTTWNGATTGRIVRLNADGTVDPTFNSGTGFAPLGTVMDIEVQADDKIMTGGSFSNYNGTARNKVCRINGNMVPDPAFTVSDSVLCGPGNVTLTDASANFPTSWLWTVSPSTGTTITNATSANANINFTTTGTYTVQLVVNNSSGADSVTKVINVYNAPVATATAMGPTAFCPGGSVQITSGTAAAYLWNNGETTQNITVTQGGIYYVNITDVNGCTDLSDTVYVVADSAVNPGICMVTTDGASINNIVYWDRAASVNVDSFIVYREVSTSIYKRIGAVSTDSLGQFIDTARSVGPANGDPNVGSYRYKLQVRDSCGNYSSLSPYHNTIYIIDAGLGQFTWSIPYTIEGGANPVANYVLLCDTANVDVWGPVAVVAGTQSSAVDPGFSNHSNIANWRVKTAWSINCDPESRVTVNTTRSNIKRGMVVTGISTETLNASVIVYPNPATGIVTVGLSPEIKSAVIRIQNTIGQVVYQRAVNAAGASGTNEQFDISGFPKGIYMVSIENNHNKIFKKLIIQ